LTAATAGAVGLSLILTSTEERCREWASTTDAIKRCELDSTCDLTRWDYMAYDQAEQRYQRHCLHLEDG
jgi:hypothetical protein